MGVNQRIVGCSNLGGTYGNQVFRGVSQCSLSPVCCAAKVDTTTIERCTPISKSMGSVHISGSCVACNSHSPNGGV